MHLEPLIHALRTHLPPVLRWGGAIARRMRSFNIALEGKHSGSSSTDALTLADLTVQELVVGALRDADPIFRQCRIEAEETTGDLARFASESKYTLALDPIDGTKQYRDRNGNGYSLILTLRSERTVHYTLVFAPESTSEGTWVEAASGHVVCGADDPSRPATAVLESLPPRHSPLTGSSTGTGLRRHPSKKIYLIGFQRHDRAKAQLVTETGLEGVAADDCPGCLYELLATGAYAGSLIHSPNVYDYPASVQICRAFGGDSLWVHNREPVNFSNLWMDDRARMLRLPGIVATSPDTRVLRTLCDLAEDWNPVRYAEE